MNFDTKQIKFGERGLVPAIVQDARTGEVLTLAYMNAESYAETRQCNRYSYRFGGLQLPRADGTWQSMRRAEKLQDPGWKLRRHGASAFSATGA